MFIIGFIVGLMLGVLLGVAIMALFFLAKKNDKGGDLLDYKLVRQQDPNHQPPTSHPEDLP